MIERSRSDNDGLHLNVENEEQPRLWLIAERGDDAFGVHLHVLGLEVSAFITPAAAREWAQVLLEAADMAESKVLEVAR